MKKLFVGLLLLALLIPTVAFAANVTSPAEIYRAVVGTEAVPGTRLYEQAEAAGKGEEFFQAMQADKVRYFNELAEEGVLTEEEAAFMVEKMQQHNYGDQEMMWQIREKLGNAGMGGPGMGGRGYHMNSGCTFDGPMGQMNPGGRMGRGR